MIMNFYYIWSFILFMFSMMFLFMGLFLMFKNISMIFEWFIFELNSLSVNYVIYLDWVSMSFTFVVFFISSMVVLYSSVYMGEYNYSSIRFLFLVLMFVFSMLLMILSPSLVSIMLGWDGLGLVSYCLVIYYSSMKSYLAGMITCLTNRLGDIGLLISIGWIFSYGSWNFLFYKELMNEYIFYIIFISSFTKSAQIPFSSWLPAAMAAPTPVSSLVHSSTLVTAGVYLLFRFYNQMFYLNNYFLFLSLITMIMSSICANYEFDLKKIIALSTLSQLGLMMSCMFMGLNDLSFFHLLSHAMFKSLLFLCSGIIIHLMGGMQDIRFMGSICLTMPLTCSCFNISNMALCGFPFFSGFYSKDLIVEGSSFSGLYFLSFVMFYIGLGLTSMYSVRLFYYSILLNYNYISFSSLGDNIYYMKYSVLLLCFYSIMFGCIFNWLMNLDLTFLLLPFLLKISTLVLVLMGLYLGYEFNYCKYLMFYSYYLLNGSMWFMYSYSYMIYNMNYLYSFYLNNSMFWGEYYGGMGLSYYMMKLSNMLQFYSFSSLKVFLLSMIIWLIILL
uniref:NADH-ubiquinone oxidoreductase chain 5 n=1 Tax=Paramacrosteles nigromaculatus TaxID=2665880 RepID=A0A5Q2MVF4_9HEMI|nr:NADH dehydrogenase subunit 5 [Paramacrosteles nigromaculatus]QGG46174.1 NADH dehydrogenase subunit 5 [Paramacrosteles nigromaculatus]